MRNHRLLCARHRVRRALQRAVDIPRHADAARHPSACRGTSVAPRGRAGGNEEDGCRWSRLASDGMSEDNRSTGPRPGRPRLPGRPFPRRLLRRDPRVGGGGGVRRRLGHHRAAGRRARARSARVPAHRRLRHPHLAGWGAPAAVPPRPPGPPTSTRPSAGCWPPGRAATTSSRPRPAASSSTSTPQDTRSAWSDERARHRGRRPRQALRRLHRGRRGELLRPHRHRVLDARAQRRRQDDDRADDDDAVPAHERHRPRRRLRRRRRAGCRAAPDGSHRPVRDGRRAAHRSREPPPHRRPLRPRPRARAPVHRGAARALLAHRGRRTRSSRTTPAACGGGSTSRPASSPPRRCSSSTSRRRVSTRAAGSSCGASCATSSATARRCFLTTQYLDEADQLADRIVVVDHGRIIAEGTPLELKDQSGRASLVVTVSRPGDVAAAAELVRAEVGEIHVDADARHISAPAEGVGRAHPHRGQPRATPTSSSTTSGCSARASTTSSSASPATGPRPWPTTRPTRDDQTTEAVR